MVEQSRNTIYRNTLVPAGHELWHKDLGGQEKVKILAAIAQKFFPNEEAAIKQTLGFCETEFRAALDSVSCDPVLSATFFSIVSKLRPRTLRREIKYEHSWTEPPVRQSGQSRERFLMVVNEHALRFPGILANTTAISDAIGVTKQRVSQLWVENKAEIPKGVNLNPGRRPRAKKPEK